MTAGIKGIGSNGHDATITTEYKGSPEQEQQARLYESAARMYCALLGSNPDDVVQIQHPQIKRAFTSIVRWKILVPDLAAFDLKMLALQSTAETRMPVEDAATETVAQ